MTFTTLHDPAIYAPRRNIPFEGAPATPEQHQALRTLVDPAVLGAFSAADRDRAVSILKRIRTLAIHRLAANASDVREAATVVGKKGDGHKPGAPKYRGRQDEAYIRANYNSERVMHAVEAVVAELDQAERDPAITALAQQVYADGMKDKRLMSFDRDHDIAEYGAGISFAVDSVIAHRADLYHRAGGVDRSTIGEINARHAAPAAIIRGLTAQAVARWLPAMQNIITRLPEGDREAAAADVQLELGRFLQTLGKLHTMAKKASTEYARWEAGFGAVDMALLEASAMTMRARDVAAEMIADAADAGFVERLRKAATDADADAAVELARVAESRFVSMSSDAWRKHKAELAEFARADGGIAPVVEVLYHARGSKFIGY